MSTHLHTYRCWACATVAVAPWKSLKRCNLCRSPMRFLWSELITTDAQRALAARGLVYNPGLTKKAIA